MYHFQSTRRSGKSPSLTLIVLLLAVMAISGCSGCRKTNVDPEPKGPTVGDPIDPAAKLVPVSGLLTIDGQPLAGAFIQVAPFERNVAQATTGPDGRFTLETFSNSDGCLQGKHVTVIVAYETTDDEAILYVPEKYMSLETTDLTVTIDQPSDDLQIDLTWGDQSGPIRLPLE